MCPEVRSTAPHTTCALTRKQPELGRIPPQTGGNFGPRLLTQPVTRVCPWLHLQLNPAWGRLSCRAAGDARGLSQQLAALFTPCFAVPFPARLPSGCAGWCQDSNPSLWDKSTGARLNSWSREARPNREGFAWLGPRGCWEHPPGATGCAGIVLRDRAVLPCPFPPPAWELGFRTKRGEPLLCPAG